MVIFSGIGEAVTIVIAVNSDFRISRQVIIPHGAVLVINSNIIIAVQFDSPADDGSIIIINILTGSQQIARMIQQIDIQSSLAEMGQQADSYLIPALSGKPEEVAVIGADVKGTIVKVVSGI